MRGERNCKVRDLRDVGRDGGIRGGGGWGGGDGGEEYHGMRYGTGQGVVPSGMIDRVGGPAVIVGRADDLYRSDIFDI